MSTDRRCKAPHHLLWVGYGLVFSVLVLLALAATGAMQAYTLRHKTTDLYQRLGKLNDDHQQSQRMLRHQVEESQQLGKALAKQRQRVQHQESAIARLARLRRQDATALTSLHNELAVRYADDARVKQRLQQLEANNAAARSVINTTPAAPVEGHP